MIGDDRLQRIHAGRILHSVLHACALMALVFPTVLRAQQDERSVRAAFLFNLTKYVSWPAPAPELKICVLGHGATGPALKGVVDGKMSDGRMIRVLLEPPDSGLHQCQ